MAPMVAPTPEKVQLCRLVRLEPTDVQAIRIQRGRESRNSSVISNK